MTRRRLGVAVFLVIGIGVHSAVGLVADPADPLPWRALVALAAFLMLPIAAWIATAISQDSVEIAYRPRGKWRHYLAAIATPIAIGAASILLLWLSGTLTVPRLGSYWDNHIVTAAFTVTIYVAASFAFALGEEIGWRGYLQPRIFPGRPLVAAAVVGMVWSAWHFPEMLTRPMSYVPDWPHLASFTVSAVAFSVLLGWLAVHGGSVWPAATAHAGYNILLADDTVIDLGSRAPRLVAPFVIIAFAAVIVAVGGFAPEPSDRKLVIRRAAAVVGVFLVLAAGCVATLRDCAAWNERLAKRFDDLDTSAGGNFADVSSEIRIEMEESRPLLCEAEF